MIKFTKSDKVDFNKYQDNLELNGHIYIDREKMKERLHRDDLLKLAYRDRATRIMCIDSGNGYRNVADNYDIYGYLTSITNIPEHYFTRTKNKRGFSVDKRYLEQAYANGYAQEFLEPYMTYRSLFRINSFITGVVSSCEETDLKSTFNRPLHKLSYQVSPQTNFRYNYKDSAIINIPLSYNDCITVPNGYVLCWGDFAQADFRIAYNTLLRDEENQKIMDKYDDKYEALARLVAHVNNEEFEYTKFKEERKFYKTLTLKTIYGGESFSSKEEELFIKKLKNFLNSCPLYVEFKKRVKARMNLGKPIILNTYFNESITIPLNTYGEDPYRQALNAPIQAGTSLLMILMVNTLLDRFYSLGYTKEDISVYYVRHDEPIFIMKRNVLKDSWIFKDAEDIYVDDWTPLKAEFFFGYTYDDADDKLMEIYEQSASLNEYKMDNTPPSIIQNSGFIPIENTLNLTVGYVEAFDGSTIIAIADTYKREVTYIRTGFTEVKAICEEVERNLALIADKLDGNGVLVNIQGYKKESFYSDTFFKFASKDITAIDAVTCLAEKAALIYAKREGHEQQPSKRYMEFQAYINTFVQINLLEK